jgi:hypothetical protein
MFVLMKGVLLGEPLAIAAVLGFLAGGVSEALIQLWYKTQIPRRKIRRRGRGSFVAILGGMAVDAGWAVPVGMIAAGSYWAVLAASLPVGVLFLLVLGAQPQDASSPHTVETVSGT